MRRAPRAGPRAKRHCWLSRTPFIVSMHHATRSRTSPLISRSQANRRRRTMQGSGSGEARLPSGCPSQRECRFVQRKQQQVLEPYDVPSLTDARATCNQLASMLWPPPDSGSHASTPTGHRTSCAPLATTGAPTWRVLSGLLSRCVAPDLLATDTLCKAAQPSIAIAHSCRKERWMVSLSSRSLVDHSHPLGYCSDWKILAQLAQSCLEQHGTGQLRGCAWHSHCARTLQSLCSLILAVPFRQS